MRCPPAPGRRVGPFLLGFALLLPGVLQAQSLYSGYVFGTPLEIGDAREVALGSVGIGLGGTALSPHDPASAVDLVLPSVAFTGQTSWTDVTQEGVASDFTSSRFPAIGIIYPIPRIATVTASFTGVLDQNWEVSEERILNVGPVGSETRVTDRFASDGGVSALRFGVARRITPNIAVGVNAGTYLGDVTRRFNPTDGTDGAGVSLDMPFEYRVGGTAILSPALYVNAGLHYADYSDATSQLDGVEGVAMLRFGGGVEWTGLSLLGKTSALRIGYRRGEMPFRPEFETEVTESVISGGLGLNLLENQGAVLAEADLGVEWGARDGSLLTEDFLRLSVSVRVSGF
ncbi:MAG: hypothetical protein P8188_11745 [Gemmatimonadota bacterium]